MRVKQSFLFRGFIGLIALFATLMILTGCEKKREVPLGTYVLEGDDTQQIILSEDTIELVNIDTTMLERVYGIIMLYSDIQEASNEGIKFSDEEKSELVKKYSAQVDYSSYRNATLHVEYVAPEEKGQPVRFIRVLDDDGEELISFGANYYMENGNIEFGPGTFVRVE